MKAPALRPGHQHPYQSAIGWGLLLLAVPLLWWVSHPSRQIVVDPAQFVFLHSLVELAAVVVSLLVFVTGYRAILPARQGTVVLLGVAFLGVGLLDFLHALSYVGMPAALTPNSAHKSIFFWLLARLLAATALLAYALLPALPALGRLHRRLALLAMLLLVGLAAAIGLAWPERLPALFVEGQGLTPLKITTEWLIIGLNLATLVALWRRRAELVRECVMALIFTVALSAVSELFFTMLGVIDKDGANVLGHAYKIAAYLYLFHATFNEALRRPLERMEAQHLREKLVLSAAPDGVLWVHHSGTILMVNPAMEAMSGYPRDELVGRNVDIFLPPALRARHARSMRDYFTAANARAMGSLDLRLMRRDGQMLPVDISLGHWQDENEQHAIAYVRDLTERKGFEESLHHRATHDELTGLPNRWLFRLQLDQALSHARRSDRRVAALFLDLDDFKTVNDSFGHLAGDELLRHVSQRLRSVLRESDTLARLGGDEFGILLSDLGSVDEAVSVAEKLLQSLDAPCRLQNQVVDIGGSIGLAFCPEDARDSEDLLRYADLAMYQAKRAGRGTYACYSAQLDQHAHENMQLHARLKEAIHRGGLRLLYQPQVDVRSGAIVGAEALVRWTDELLGEVPPGRFIPVAETTGLILPLSDWVLDTACRQIAAWSGAGTPLRVAVNFSAQQFRQRNLPDKVAALLQRSGAQAKLLEIEITESIAMVQPLLAREQLDALVALGCTVALDDFGTGYSSLAYLKALPVSKLKIDRGFIKDIPHDLSDVKISRSIIALAHSLGLTLVAEGVETEAQLDFLREHGCETYQGWLFAKALEAGEFSARLHASSGPP
ncbi:bifunctional diguanylate cyclase/phosphodiesterase [Roseateles toxinivorans]|uniref:PAS domain S-box-containing protein/diguanylate cyclase (GGDEF)-like protein n=1 Tax=Roseateles toxinivorans TaxID=270368 RepID=A0A4R6QMT0_9BURK|nr:EAL domain-containing protein [Roseateles toxinivorans]TDP71265.1 PAS domain S-box-containing protein/diguanylate cyclase (GGDEF)-like protein [Roseateles toxinivorans]